MRYITATPPLNIQGIAEPITWETLTGALMQESAVIETLGVLATLDMRKKLAAGGVVALSDAEWAILKQVADKPKTLTPALIFAPGAEAFFRAIADAPTAPPESHAASSAAS